MIIKLLELTNRAEAHGTQEGKVVYQKLVDIVSAHYNENSFNISIEGVLGTDASFARESVLSIAKQYRDEGKWFFLTGKMTADMWFNWDLAAKFKDQPLILWNGNDYKILGPDPGSSLSGVVDIVIANAEVTTAEIADKLGLSVQNASSKLKKLSAKGYISRCERVAESGGIEFVYRAIK